MEAEANVLNDHTVVSIVNLFLRGGMRSKLSHLFYQYMACSVITVGCAQELL